MESEEIKKTEFLQEDAISSIEKNIDEESKKIIQLSKRLFWNNLIIIFFMTYCLFYILLAEYIRKEIIIILIATIIIPSLERLWLHYRIKKKASKLAIFLTMIEILKNE